MTLMKAVLATFVVSQFALAIAKDPLIQSVHKGTLGKVLVALKGSAPEAVCKLSKVVDKRKGGEKSVSQLIYKCDLPKGSDGSLNPTEWARVGKAEIRAEVSYLREKGKIYNLDLDKLEIKKLADNEILETNP